MHWAFLVLGAALSSRVFARELCDNSQFTPCISDLANRDYCCAPSSRLELSQTWDEQRSQWVLEAIRVISCDGQTEETRCDPSRAYPSSKIQNLVEGYARHAVPLMEVSRSLGWGGIGPNASDDDVAAVWAQHWAQHGTCISTFRPTCFDTNMPPGEEDAWNDPGPALFIKAIHQQQEALLAAQKPLMGEPHQTHREISLAGTPLLGTFRSMSADKDTKQNEKAPVVQKLSFFADRDRERAIHHERDFGGFHHEEL